MFIVRRRFLSFLLFMIMYEDTEEETGATDKGMPTGHVPSRRGPRIDRGNGAWLPVARLRQSRKECGFYRFSVFHPRWNTCQCAVDQVLMECRWKCRCRDRNGVADWRWCDGWMTGEGPRKVVGMAVPSWHGVTPAVGRRRPLLPTSRRHVPDNSITANYIAADGITCPGTAWHAASSGLAFSCRAHVPSLSLPIASDRKAAASALRHRGTPADPCGCDAR